MRIAILVAAAAATVLAGCEGGVGGVDPRAAGALGGAALGAAAGLLVGGDDRLNAAVGAGVGAVAGLAVGEYLRRQQEQMEQDLAGTGATVTNTGQSLIVSLPSNVTFAVDSAQIDARFVEPLTDFAMTLRNYPSSLVDVVGHTDSTGAEEYNQRLSEARARSVADFFAARGVQRERLVAYGFGETRPITTNDTPEGRAQNRRVEVTITPITDTPTT
jgi:outer membrane protein OmpA-like peptidoglycan-associated protein